MEIDAFLDLVKRRRSVRRFKPDPVPDEAIEKVLEAARWAASGANSQPWEFIVVKDPEKKRAIAEVFVESSRAMRQIDRSFPHQEESTLQEKFAGAPVLVVVCGDPHLKEAYPLLSRREETFHVSMGAALQHLHLAVAALGLGSCWGTVGNATEGPLKEILKIPRHLQVFEVISVGYPAAPPRPGYRRELEAMVHRERLDGAKIRSDEEIRGLLAARTRADIYSGRR